MTSSVISTSQTTTETLGGNFDDLLVTSSGSIIVTTQDENGIDATGSDQEITINGLVYSINSFENSGVDITGDEATLNISGAVQGDTGVQVNDAAYNRISVASQGGIIGANQGVLLQGNAGDAAATDNILVNAGDISGGFGVLVQYGGDDVIDNSGQIAGDIGVFLSGNADTETVENSGTITGNASTNSSGSAIETASGAGIDVVNSGLLTNDEANAIGSSSAVLTFGDDGGTTSTIDNTGSITGSGYVIQSTADILDISNSGTVHGGLYSAATVDVENSGAWAEQAGTAPVFVLDGGNNSVTNTASGVIGGAISTIHSQDTLNNAGSIDGSIALVSGGDTITNSGSIDGPITFAGSTDTNSLTNSGTVTGAVALSGGYNTVDNSGRIDGEVSMAHSEDTFSNAGTIDGAVALTAGGDTFTNTGAIAGEVAFLSSGTTNTFTNSGNIGGNVTLTAPSSSLTNHGLIYGNIILGSDDTLTNTGTIHGSVTLGGSDTFEASGNFGHVTFDDFVAGTGSTHDTIRFAANDFSTFSQVQAASTQQGSDVVIKLDATDALTLTNVTLSSLVSADFTFV